VGEGGLGGLEVELAGPDFRDGGVGCRDLPVHGLGGHALPQVALNAGPGRQVPDLLAHGPVHNGRPAKSMRAAAQVDEAPGRVDPAPGGTDAGSLVGQAGASDTPALTGGSDDIGRRDPDLVNEHLVEVGGAGHLTQGTDADTGAGMTAPDYRLVAAPAHFSCHTTAPPGPAPELGRRTEEVLLEAGLDWDPITVLREGGGLG